MSDTPLVTIAIPLYKSRPFLDIIIGNLDTLAYPNLEILLSDRHCADDTLDVLERRYGSNPRFHFLRAQDEIGWVEHYNALLSTGTGKYFLWMPHDDTYAKNYISELVKTLEQAPDAVAAYGNMLVMWGNAPDWIRGKPPPAADVRWTWRNALALFLDGELSLAMRGLFRRDMLVGHKLWLQHTWEDNAADMVWLFAVASTGRLVWTPETWCQKRYYMTSTHAAWKPRTWRHTLAEIHALRANLVENQTSLPARLRGSFLLLIWAVLRFGRNLLDATSFVTSLEGQIRRLALHFVRPARD